MCIFLTCLRCWSCSGAYNASVTRPLHDHATGALNNFCQLNVLQQNLVVAWLSLSRRVACCHPLFFMALPHPASMRQQLRQHRMLPQAVQLTGRQAQLHKKTL